MRSRRPAKVTRIVRCGFICRSCPLRKVRSLSDCARNKRRRDRRSPGDNRDAELLPRLPGGGRADRGPAEWGSEASAKAPKAPIMRDRGEFVPLRELLDVEATIPRVVQALDVRQVELR